MTHSLMRSLAPMTLLCALAWGGCQQDKATARSAQIDNASGIRILISGVDELNPEQVHAISQTVEAKAQDVSAAMVRMKKAEGDDDESNIPASLEIEIWGAGLPDSAGLVSQIKADFPALADAAIEIVDLAPGSGPAQMAIEVDDEATPEEAKQQIIESLEADGVEGEIDVLVEDVEEGRRIEVSVEKHDEIEE